MNELRGYLVERWVQTVQGCAAHMGRLFQPLRFTNAMAPLLFEIGLDIVPVFAKYLIFDKFILWLTYRLSKSIYA